MDSQVWREEDEPQSIGLLYGHLIKVEGIQVGQVKNNKRYEK